MSSHNAPVYLLLAGLACYWLPLVVYSTFQAAACDDYFQPLQSQLWSQRFPSPFAKI